MSFEEQQKLSGMTEAEDRRIAGLESRAAKWHDLLSDAISERRGGILVVFRGDFERIRPFRGHF